VSLKYDKTSIWYVLVSTWPQKFVITIGLPTVPEVDVDIRMKSYLMPPLINIFLPGLSARGPPDMLIAGSPADVCVPPRINKSPTFALGIVKESATVA